VRGGKGVYQYQDDRGIEPHERDFLVHPCFREALRATSGMDVRPYEDYPICPEQHPSATEVLVSSKHEEV
jgi:hypothetical protein